MPAQIVPVIMCGGAGTRLWPISRESMPKQFVPLIGQDLDVPAGARADLATRPVRAPDHHHQCRLSLRRRRATARVRCRSRHRARADAPRFRARGCGRRRARGWNAIAEAIVLVLAADHVIRKPRRIPATPAGGRRSRGRRSDRHLRHRADPSGDQLRLHPPGRQLNGASVRAVDAFVEKPDATTAAGYVADHYLWNSGNFLFHAATMLGEIERFEPDMAEAAKAAVAALTRDLDFLRLAAEPFARAPKKSIDYAVMERTKLAAVVPADLGWSDIGSWSTVWDVLDHDAAGNATDGPGRDAGHAATAWCAPKTGADHRDRARRRHRRLDRGRGAGHRARQSRGGQGAGRASSRRRTSAKRSSTAASTGPGATIRMWTSAERYRVKRIVVKPGSKLSLQKHFHRSEHWVVVHGTAEVTVGNDMSQRARERIDLYPDRQRSPARQSGQNPARIDRGAGRQLSRRGRHRAPRRRLWAAGASAVNLKFLSLLPQAREELLIQNRTRNQRRQCPFEVRIRECR